MFQLRFAMLHNQGRGYTFPCDQKGVVNLDALTEKQRVAYYYAHALVGRDFSSPQVQFVPEGAETCVISSLPSIAARRA